jgi:hypothetical protein
MKRDDRLIFEAFKQSRTKVIKEEGEQPAPETPQHDETDMSNPAEKREVTIGNEILQTIVQLEHNPGNPQEQDAKFEVIKELAQELVDMHSSDGPVVKPGTGTKALYKRGSVL